MRDRGSRATPPVSSGARPHLLVISQVYVPDTAAVGQYVADAAEEMARRGWDVRVLTASRGYEDPSVCYGARQTIRGVAVRRLPISSFGKRSIAIRLIAQMLFVAQAFLRGLFGRRPDLILVSTSPPFAGFVGMMLAACRRTPFVWWVMDVNPDQMIAAGKLKKTSVVARVFDWMNRATLRRAQAVVALDRHMASRLERKRPVEARMAVIPPWPLVEPASNVLPKGSQFRGLHGLAENFVVMYSGNHALQHPLDTLLDAAKALESDPRLAFVFVGGGAGKTAVEQRIAAGATNLRSFPAVPLEDLREVVSAADIHVVTMGDDMVGIVHPSKIYGALAAGRPILYFGPAQSHVAEIVEHHRIGWVLCHGDVQAAVTAIRMAASAETEQVRAMGERATNAVSQSLSSNRLRKQFCDQLASVACGDTTPSSKKPRDTTVSDEASRHG